MAITVISRLNADTVTVAEKNIWATVDRVFSGAAMTRISMAIALVSLVILCTVGAPPAAIAQGVGFDLLEGQDLPGYDLRAPAEDQDLQGISASGCENACRNEPACNAYTFNVTRKWCFLKYAPGDSVPFSGAISGIRKGAPDQRTDPDFIVIENYDLPEHDIRTPAEDPALSDTTFEGCREACRQDTDCQAFTYNERARKCFLKTTPGQALAFRGAISGVRVESVSVPTSPEVKITVQSGHQFEVNSIALSPDGTKMVTASDDRSIRLWDVVSGRLIRTFGGREGRVNTVAFSPDGSRIASGSDRGSIKVWDVVSGRLLRTIVHEETAYPEVLSLAFSPDGKLILSGGALGKHEAYLWDVETGRLVRQYDMTRGGITNSVAFSTEGSLIAAGGNRRYVEIWDVASGRLVRSIEADQVQNVFFVAFSPDSTQLLTAGSDGISKIWDLSSGQLVRSFDVRSPDGRITQYPLDGDYDWRKEHVAAFSPDGRMILSSVSYPGVAFNDETVDIWDVSSGQLVSEAKLGGVSAATFSPDNERVFVAISGEDIVEIDLVSGRATPLIESQQGWTSVISYSPDGRFLLSARGRSLALWDVASGGLSYSVEIRDHVSDLVFFPDGTKILVKDGYSLKLFDASSGLYLRSIGEHLGWGGPVAISPDGRRVVSAGKKIFRIWDVSSGHLVREFEAHQNLIEAVAFSPDGSRLLSSQSNGILRLWDVSSGRLLVDIDSQARIRSAVFSPDGTRILVGHAHSISLWDSRSGDLLYRLNENLEIDTVAFSPNGAHFLSAGWDWTVRLWDSESGELLRSFEGHEGPVHEVAFSPDGRRAVSSSRDGSIIFWDIQSGKMLSRSVADDKGDWLTIVPEGYFHASENGAQLVNVVHGLEVFGVDRVYRALYRPDLVQAKLAGDPDGLVRAATTKLDLSKVLKGGQAPDVQIVSPSEDTSLTQGDVRIQIRITDRGGGVGNVEWRVDGVLVGHRRGQTEPSPVRGDNQIVLSKTISLDPTDVDQQYEIEVVAYNAENLIASTPRKLLVRWDGQATIPSLFVLAVGVSDYWDSSLRLTYAAKDAEAFAETIAQAAQSVYGSVTARLLVNEEATKQNVREAIAELGTEMQPQDAFVLFLAGHGKTHDGAYYFLPYEIIYSGTEVLSTQGISQNEWQEWLPLIPAGKNLWLIDTCESGAMVQTRGIENKTAMEKLLEATGRAIFTATSDVGLACEGYQGHGVFTYAILDAFEAADYIADGQIMLSELETHVVNFVPEWSVEVFGPDHRQVPQILKRGEDFALGRALPRQ